MCSKQALPLNETMTYNNVLTPLVLVTNKNDEHLDKLQPDGLQSTPVGYQGCFGLIGQNSDPFDKASSGCHHSR